MGLEGHRKEDDSSVEFSFFQSLRKGGWWANWLQSKPKKIRKIVEMGIWDWWQIQHASELWSSNLILDILY